MNILKHWATILLGLIVAGILFVTVFSYQVEENEGAVTSTLGKVSVVEPAKFLNFRWPFPFQSVTKYDTRVRTFAGKTGRIEETQTKDEQSVVVGIFVNYRISDVLKFYLEMGTVSKAESDMDGWLRNAKLTTLGRHNFSDLVNATGDTKYDQIREEMKNELNARANPFGITIEYVGINVLNVPANISKDVFSRMIAERKAAAAKALATGELESRNIRTEANAQRDKILAEAEGEARETRAKGDAEAAQYYEVFKQNPELASFLRKLEALDSLLKTRTTLILDPSTPPLDLLSPGAITPAIGEKK